MVYVAEYGNHCISVFTIDGAFIQHIGHRGSGEGEFNTPLGITVDTLGNLYVGDHGNNRVVIIIIIIIGIIVENSYLMK